MAIKSKFIIFDTLSNFLSTNGIGGTAPSTDYIGNIPKGAVVFIKNTGLIWFNGNYFGPNINNYYTKTLIDNKLDRKQDEYYRQYLTFTALESGTFTFTKNALQYSLDDGSTWETLAADTASPTVSAGNKILWKQTDITPNYTNGIGRFNATGNFNISGNIMSLLFGDNFIGQTDLTGKDNTFRHLFKNNTKLVNAENLILSATTLASCCYANMFRGCTSLTTAPQLPATTLASSCYQCMFLDCTSLTEAPQLLATTLASSCYQQMFYNCRSLATAPELPATTLAEYCYNGMFANCRQLNYIKCLATNISAYSCTFNWVIGVASSGTFVKDDNMDDWTVGKHGIPTGWVSCTEDEYKEVRHYLLDGTFSDKNYPVLLDSSTKKLYVNVPWTDNNTTSFTITANATDGLWDITGTNGTNAVTYAVGAYGSQQSKASFDTSSTTPTRSDRLNYNGYLYATKLFSGGVEVLTSHQSLSNYYTKTESDNKYVYKSGDTITGNLTVNGNTTLNKHILINPYDSNYGSNPVSLYWNDVKHTIVGNTKLDGTNNTAVDFLHSGNSSSAASSAVQLSFGETSKLATINGVDVKVTMPSQTTFVGYKFNDSIGGRNYFSKNTVVGSNITKTTSINGYTINSSNGINRILNLGFNGYVGNWTVTFELKASAACSVNVNLCDTSASTAHGEQSTTSVTTEYVKHRYVFLNVSRYNTAENNGYNGFLDIENSENKTIYVKDIKIEKGIIASDWFYAPEDLATQTWVGSLITNGNVSLLSGFKVNEWGFLYKYMHSASTSFLNGFFYITIEFDGSNTHWEEIYILSESSSDTNLRIELVRSDGLRVYNSNTGSMGGLFSSITTRGISVSGKTIIALSSNGYATRYGQLYFTVNVYSKYKDFTLTIANNSLYDVVSNTDDIINLGYSNTTTTYLNDQNVNGTVYPAITNKHNLGLPSYKWNNLYLSNNISDGTNSLTVANIKSTYDWYQTMTTGDTDGTINKWKEIESFVNEISDTSTLNGILAGKANMYSYTIGGGKTVRITYDSYQLVIISASGPNKSGLLVLIGSGYGEEGATRNKFTEVVSCSTSMFTWSLPASSSISRSIEIHSNRTNDSTITVISTGSVTFTEISALTTAALNAPLATQSWVTSQGYITSHQSLSNYLPLSGGTMKSNAYIGFDNDAAAFRMQIGADTSTSPLRGITTPTVGGKWIGIFARPGKSTDEGGFLLSQEGAAIYNSFDSGFGFKVVDTDANLNDWNSADSVVFSVKNDNTVYSKGGFVKKNSSDSYVLLGGGGHKAVSDFATSSHNHTFKLGSTTITTNGSQYTTINGPLAVVTSASPDNAFSIQRESASEGVKHWVDDSTYHIEYTNDEAANQIAFRFINTDTERSENKGVDASDNTVYLDYNKNFYPDVDNTGSIGTSLNKWKNMYATNFYGNLTGNATTATTATSANEFNGYSIDQNIIYKSYSSPGYTGYNNQGSFFITISANSFFNKMLIRLADSRNGTEIATIFITQYKSGGLYINSKSNAVFVLYYNEFSGTLVLSCFNFSNVTTSAIKSALQYCSCSVQTYSPNTTITFTKGRNDTSGYSYVLIPIGNHNILTSSIKASSFVKTNGTSSLFLKADGSVDSTTYATKALLDNLALNSGSGTVTSVATGVGLTGGPITATGTIKASLKSETASSLTATAMGSTTNRQYAVGVDANGHLSVNIPWIDNSDLLNNYLHLSGGTLNNNAVISRTGTSVAWVNGRSNPIIKTTSYTGYNAILSMKTTNGSWDLGVYSNDIAYLTYITDTNYSSSNNAATYLLVFPKKNGTIAITSDIPTKTSQLTNDSGFLTSHQSLANYLPLSGGTMTGKITFNQTSTTRDVGIIGTYDPLKAAAIWSMGSSYLIKNDGTTLGSLYGAAYVYFGKGYTFGEGYSGGHSFVWALNGTINVALGNYVWSRGGFVKKDSSDSYVLLGGGGHKAVSDFLPLVTHSSMSTDIPSDLVPGIHVIHRPNVEYSSILAVKDYSGSFALLYFHPTASYTDRIYYRKGSASWYALAYTSDIPTKTSQLTNDSGFLTSHQSLANYLQLSGGTMTGIINWGEGSTREILLFSTNSTWKSGLRYSWSGNTTISLWGKHTNTQFVWNAGSDAELKGDSTKTYDFLVGRDTSGTFNGSVVGRIAGNVIIHSGNISSYAITSHQSLSNYVTLNGDQTITGAKTFNGTKFILAGNESNEILNIHYNNGLYYKYDDSAVLGSNVSIRNALRFRWYNDYWVIGNIRSGNTSTYGFGIALLNNDGTHLLDRFRVNKDGAGFLNGLQIATLTWVNNLGFLKSYLNTWQPANTSQEGYVPKLTINSTAMTNAATDLVLTYKYNTSETTPVWRKLPDSAFQSPNDGTITFYSLDSGLNSGNAYSVGTFSANLSGDTSLTIKAGNNITLTGNATNHTITITSSYSNDNTTSALYVGGSGNITSNSAQSSNGNVYLSLRESSGTYYSHKITGSGGTTVTSDSSGNITINSTSSASYNVVSSSDNGLAPKVTTTNSNVSVGTGYYFLATSSSTSTPAWYKLPSTAFRDILINGTSISNNTLNIKSGGGISVGKSNGTATISLYISVNGSTADDSTSIYAPTTAGTSGYILLSNGSGAPGWTSFTSISSIVKIQSSVPSSFNSNTLYVITG